MARREAIITIADDNRDKGKTFLITEMPASHVEWWATRALQALARSGVELPDNIADAGLAGIAVIGLKGLGNMSTIDTKELMDEMFACIEIRPDPMHHPDLKRKLIESDIEEITTRLRLRREVLELHLGFSLAGGPSTTESLPPAQPTLSNIRTSRARSAR